MRVGLEQVVFADDDLCRVGYRKEGEIGLVEDPHEIFVKPGGTLDVRGHGLLELTRAQGGQREIGPGTRLEIAFEGGRGDEMEALL